MLPNSFPTVCTDLYSNHIGAEPGPAASLNPSIVVWRRCKSLPSDGVNGIFVAVSLAVQIRTSKPSIVCESPHVNVSI